MYCTECGIILSDTAKFCSSCGNKLSASEESTIPKHRKQGRDIDTKQQKYNEGGFTFTLFIIFILCFGIIFLPMGSFGESFYDRASVGCFMYEAIGCEYRNSGLLITLFFGIIGLISLLLFIGEIWGEEPEGHSNTPTKDVEQSQQNKPKRRLVRDRIIVDPEKTDDEKLWELAQFESRKGRE